eukprot:5493546-Prorocentrum_lima.AAC.1
MDRRKGTGGGASSETDVGYPLQIDHRHRPVLALLGLHHASARAHHSGRDLHSAALPSSIC